MYRETYPDTDMNLNVIKAIQRSENFQPDDRIVVFMGSDDITIGFSIVCFPKTNNCISLARVICTAMKEKFLPMLTMCAKTLLEWIDKDINRNAVVFTPSKSHSVYTAWKSAMPIYNEVFENRRYGGVKPSTLINNKKWTPPLKSGYILKWGEKRVDNAHAFLILDKDAVSDREMPDEDDDDDNDECDDDVDPDFQDDTHLAGSPPKRKQKKVKTTATTPISATKLDVNTPIIELADDDIDNLVNDEDLEIRYTHLLRVQRKRITDYNDFLGNVDDYIDTAVAQCAENIAIYEADKRAEIKKHEETLNKINAKMDKEKAECIVTCTDHKNNVAKYKEQLIDAKKKEASLLQSRRMIIDNPDVTQEVLPYYIDHVKPTLSIVKEEKKPEQQIVTSPAQNICHDRIQKVADQQNVSYDVAKAIIEAFSGAAPAPAVTTHESPVVSGENKRPKSKSSSEKKKKLRLSSEKKDRPEMEVERKHPDIAAANANKRSEQYLQ